MNINWYPGHMKKTKELLQNNLKLVDLVFEVLDSRIPYSSKNPDIDKIIQNKPRLIILNKSDLSNQEGNEKWAKYYKKDNVNVAFVNALENQGIDKLIKEANKSVADKLERLENKGIKNKTIRVMITGIPNVGKSTLINTLAGRKSAKTGNRPGVTTGKQWIKLKGNLELLDTPGILWPKLEEESVALNLAFTGAIKDQVIDIETLSLRFVEKLMCISPNLLTDRYGVEIHNKTGLEVLDDIALKRGCIIKGGEIDYGRVSHMILDEFRRGVIGRITLELPENI